MKISQLSNHLNKNINMKFKQLLVYFKNMGVSYSIIKPDI